MKRFLEKCPKLLVLMKPWSAIPRPRAALTIKQATCRSTIPKTSCKVFLKSEHSVKTLPSQALANPTTRDEAQRVYAESVNAAEGQSRPNLYETFKHFSRAALLVIK